MSLLVGARHPVLAEKGLTESPDGLPQQDSTLPAEMKISSEIFAGILFHVRALAAAYDARRL